MTTAVQPKPVKAKRLWTYDETRAQLPETNLPCELWKGEITMAPASRADHQRIVGRFHQKLGQFVQKTGAGEVLASPVDVVLTQQRTVQPDVVFAAKARLGIIKDFIAGAPDLAMEVISETTWRCDRIGKKALYEQFGLPEYWIVDPDSETIEVFVLVRGVYQAHSRAIGARPAQSKLLPGFRVAFKELLG